MLNRTPRSRLLRTLALSLFAASSVLMPQFAKTARAVTEATNDWIQVPFPTGVFKLKTTWGGGYALNIGGAQGSFTAGTLASVYWNGGWDNQNRFIVVGAPRSMLGHSWVKLQNRWSQLCLSADALTGLVTQQACSFDNENQFWALQGAVGSGPPAAVRNLRLELNGLEAVMAQDYLAVNSSIHMDLLSMIPNNNTERHIWIYDSCMSNGVETQHC